MHIYIYIHDYFDHAQKHATCLTSLSCKLSLNLTPKKVAYIGTLVPMNLSHWMYHSLVSRCFEAGFLVTKNRTVWKPQVAGVSLENHLSSGKTAGLFRVSQGGEIQPCVMGFIYIPW